MDKCPQCGFDPSNSASNKPFTHAMSEYVTMDTGKSEGIFNTDDDFLTVKGVKLLRKDLFLKQQAAKRLTEEQTKLTPPATPTKAK